MTDDRPVAVGDKVVTYATVMSMVRGSTMGDGEVYSVKGPKVSVDFNWTDEEGIKRFECVPYLVHDLTWAEDKGAWLVPAFSDRSY